MLKISEEIFLFNNKGLLQSTAEEAGINEMSDDEIYEKFFEMAKKKINENKLQIN